LLLSTILPLVTELELLKNGAIEAVDGMAEGVENSVDRINSALGSIDPTGGGRYGHTADTSLWDGTDPSSGGRYGHTTNTSLLDPHNLQGRRDFTNLNTGAGIVSATEWWKNNLQGRTDFTDLMTGAGIFDLARRDFTNQNTGAGIVSSDEWWNNNLQGRRNYRYYGGAIKAQYGKYLGGFQSSMVPVMAHGGEYVMSARAVQNVGLSKLESMNHSRNYQGGGGGGTNIFVENFIGEPEWFESMMGEYNVSVAPKNERSRGLESRKISSMADNNKRGRV